MVSRGKYFALLIAVINLFLVLYNFTPKIIEIPSEASSEVIMEVVMMGIASALSAILVVIIHRHGKRKWNGGLLYSRDEFRGNLKKVIANDPIEKQSKLKSFFRFSRHREINYPPQVPPELRPELSGKYVESTETKIHPATIGSILPEYDVVEKTEEAILREDYDKKQDELSKIAEKINHVNDPKPEQEPEPEPEHEPSPTLQQTKKKVNFKNIVRKSSSTEKKEIQDSVKEIIKEDTEPEPIIKCNACDNDILPDKVLMIGKDSYHQYCYDEMRSVEIEKQKDNMLMPPKEVEKSG